METAQIVQDDDNQPLLFGSLVFLGAIFLVGLIVNLPAAVVCLRSRKLRGFTDKFILFVLAVDLFSLFTLIPISILFIHEQSAHVNQTDSRYATFLADRPTFLDGDAANTLPKNSVDGSSSRCVQQWILIIHKFIFIMVANLSVLGAFKIAVERYLAVVTPLHYHRFLKSSVVISIAFTSVLFGFASALLPTFDPEDFPTSELDEKCYPHLFSPLWSSSLISKSTLALSTGLKLKGGLVDNAKSIEAAGLTQESPFSSSKAWWWPVLKLTHVAVFFVVPIIGMTFMYLRIWTEARKQHARMTHHNKGPFIQIIPPDADAGKTENGHADGLQWILRKFKLVQQLKQRARMDRAARVAVLTVGLLIICFGPLHYGQMLSAISSLKGSAIHFWEMHDSEKDAGSKFKRLLPTLLACLHPILSPLVYVYRYQKVRSELKTFLKKKISSLNCCHEKHDPTDCQDFVQQCNNLPHTLPGPSCADAAENLEPPVMSTVDSETIITVDVEYLSASECGAELVAECPSKIQAQVSCHVAHSSVSIQVEEDVRRQECSESDSENQDCREEQVISIETKTKNGLLEYVRCWVSRRWNHHRDSVANAPVSATKIGEEFVVYL